MIDFAKLNNDLLLRALSLVQSWLPDGKREGDEWVSRNPTRPDRELGSFKVNLRLGIYCDFASGEKGGDLISLFAFIRGLKQGEAARRIIDEQGLPLHSYINGTGNGHAAREPDRYEIRDCAGRLVATHCRIDAHGKTPKKLWWMRDGSNGLKGLSPEALPLCASEYLPELPDDATVTVVEGEKACVRLRRFGLDAFGTVCGAPMTPGDGELQPLLRFIEIILWPDHDKVGHEHMRKIAARLLALGFQSDRLRILDPARVEGLSALEGGDAADLNDDQLREALESAVIPFAEFHDDDAKSGDDGATGSGASRARPSAGAQRAEQAVEDCEAAPKGPYSDIALSHRLVKEHGANLRHATDGWYLYDSARGLWEYDSKLRVFSLAKSMLAAVSHEVFESVLESSGDEASARRAANAITSAKAVAAVVTLARSHPAIAITVDQFDRDNLLLNTPGDVVNLRDGSTRPALREDYFTKTTVVAARDIPTPVFDQFMLDIMGAHVSPADCVCAPCLKSSGKLDAERQAAHDAEVTALVKYLLRVYGYCLTGDIREHALFFQLGDGGNGKGALNDFVELDLMGKSPIGYACTIPIEALLVAKGERHPTELMDLFHVRLALARESDEGTIWNEGRVKSLTGDAVIKARRMRQDYIEFSRTHKLIPFGNVRPALRGADQGAWKRRLQLINFPQKWDDEADDTKHIRKADKGLDAKLRAEAPGVLHKLISGCLEYQKIGIAPPQTVREASDAYLREQNAVARWADERLDREDPDATTTVEQLWLDFYGMGGTRQRICRASSRL